MRRLIWYAGTPNSKHPELNHRQPMISHLHHGASESFWISGALIFALLVYLRGWLRLPSHDQENFKGWRVVSFVLGLLFIWIASASPLATLDHEMLTAHMAQHLLLMTLAPPLILLGMPRKALGRPFRSEPVRKFASVITQPAFCWVAAAATLVLWHIPAVFMLGLRSPIWHGAEQASFVVTGLLFWSPVVLPFVRPLSNRLNRMRWPEWSILLYLFLATLPCDILSGFLVFCDRVVYPVFLTSQRSFGLSALEDQQCAGALMWTCVTVVYLIAGTIFTVRLLSPHQSPQRSLQPSDDLAIPRDGLKKLDICEGKMDGLSF
jgi:putative membrane protein